MAIVALILIAILALCVFVLLGAVLELHQDVRQMRKIVGALDTPTTLNLGEAIGGKATDYGLPITEDSVLVLFLSETCETCQILASSLSSQVPAGLWVVLGGRDAASVQQFYDRHFLSLDVLSSRRVILDFDSEVFGRIGLSTTPAGVRVKSGVMTQATTVPSVRYLTSIIPDTIKSYKSTVSSDKESDVWVS